MKKLAALILAALMCFALLSGCGGKQGGEPEQSDMPELPDAPEQSDRPELSDSPEQLFETQLREQLTLAKEDFVRFYGSFNFTTRDEIFLFNFDNIMMMQRADRKETVDFLCKAKTEAKGEAARLCDEACSLYLDTDNCFNMSRREYVDFLQRLYLYTDSLCEYLDIPFPDPGETISFNYLPVTEEVIHAAQEGDYFDEAMALTESLSENWSDFSAAVKAKENLADNLLAVANEIQKNCTALVGLEFPVGYEEAQRCFDEAAARYVEAADLIKYCAENPSADDFASKWEGIAAPYSGGNDSLTKGLDAAGTAASLPGIWRDQGEHHIVFYLGKAYIAAIDDDEYREYFYNEHYIEGEYNNDYVYIFDDGVYTFTVEGLDPFEYRKYAIDRAAEMTCSISGNTITFTPTGDGRSFEMTYDDSAKTITDKSNGCVYSKSN